MRRLSQSHSHFPSIPLATFLASVPQWSTRSCHLNAVAGIVKIHVVNIINLNKNILITPIIILQTIAGIHLVTLLFP